MQLLKMYVYNLINAGEIEKFNVENTTVQKNHQKISIFPFVEFAKIQNKPG